MHKRPSLPGNILNPPMQLNWYVPWSARIAATAENFPEETINANTIIAANPQLEIMSVDSHFFYER